MLTVAHLVWTPEREDKKLGSKDFGEVGFYERILVVPGANGNAPTESKKKPFGEYRVTNISLQRGYKEMARYCRDQSSEKKLLEAENELLTTLDIAVLELDRNVEGLNDGFFEVRALPTAKIDQLKAGLQMNSYGDSNALKVLDGIQKQQYLSIKAVERFVLRGYPPIFGYPRVIKEAHTSTYATFDANTTKGDSGAPIWFLDGVQPVVIGVHKGGRFNNIRGNSGVLIDNAYVKWIKWAISER